MEVDTKTTIEDVPEEVMIEIFEYLSPKLLKIAAIVCKRSVISISQQDVGR